MGKFHEFKTFSELALELTPNEMTDFAAVIAQIEMKELHRRMEEGIGLYRSWDDEPEQEKR